MFARYFFNSLRLFLLLCEGFLLNESERMGLKFRIGLWSLICQFSFLSLCIIWLSRFRRRCCCLCGRGWNRRRRRCTRLSFFDQFIGESEYKQTLIKHDTNTLVGGRIQLVTFSELRTAEYQGLLPCRHDRTLLQWDVGRDATIHHDSIYIQTSNNIDNCIFSSNGKGKESTSQKRHVPMPFENFVKRNWGWRCEWEFPSFNGFLDL
jgi:hypothetical protein